MKTLEFEGKIEKDWPECGGTYIDDESVPIKINEAIAEELMNNGHSMTVEHDGESFETLDGGLDNNDETLRIKVEIEVVDNE